MRYAEVVIISRVGAHLLSPSNAHTPSKTLKKAHLARQALLEATEEETQQ